MTCLSTIFFMQFFVSANPSTTCCDSISRSVTEGPSAPQTAASFCCPSYENRLLASTRTELNAALGMYGSPYAAAAAAAGQNYANYFPYSADPSAIYSSLVRVALSSDERGSSIQSIDSFKSRLVIDYFGLVRGPCCRLK